MVAYGSLIKRESSDDANGGMVRTLHFLTEVNMRDCYLGSPGTTKLPELYIFKQVQFYVFSAPPM